MEYHIAICDDEETASAYISGLTRQWADNLGHTVRIETFASAEAFLFHYAEHKDYDILLLDIEMGRMNGVELAKRVRLGNKEVQIVFITGYMDYIADGYEVEALHYLMKPVGFEKLSAVLDRAAKKLERNEKALLLEIQDEIVRIPLYEIRYLEVQKNYVTIHAGEDYTVKKSLGSLEKELDDGFFRIGRSFVVSLRFVQRISKTEVTLKDKTVLPLSRGIYEPLNRAMIRYF